MKVADFYNIVEEFKKYLAFSGEFGEWSFKGEGKKNVDGKEPVPVLIFHHNTGKSTQEYDVFGYMEDDKKPAFIYSDGSRFAWNADYANEQEGREM